MKNGNDGNTIDNDTRKAIAECHAYFDQLGLAKTLGDDPNPNIADSDGLVSYVNASANPPPDKLMEEYRKVSSILEGFTGIVTAAVLQISGDDDKKKHLASTWNGPLAAIVKAFFGPYSDSDQTENKTVIGLEIATQFLEILLAAAVAGGPAMAGFKSFLESQGKTIQAKGGKSVVGYKYACVGIAHEMFELQPGQWMYVPKLKYYFTDFTQENVKISIGCASAEKFQFDFDMRQLSAAFRLEYWRQNKDFRKEVDDFIAKYTKANIKESTNYFDGIFASKPSSAGLSDLRLAALENRALQVSAAP